MDRLQGKTCLITGANAGIGKATALGLAKLGATVVLLCRDADRGGRALRQIVKRSGNDAVHLLVADLRSQREIRRAVGEFEAAHNGLHVLINNAGLFLAKCELTEDGLETVFAVNHLAPYLLTNLLRARLEASAPSRVVTVSSDAHRRATPDFNDGGCGPRYNWIDAYARSKLANVLFTYELARRLERTGVTATCLHPGVVATRIWMRNHTPFHYFLRLFTVFYSRPATAAKAVIALAADPDHETTTGTYFNRMAEARSSRASYDEAAAKRLWDMSARLTGLGA